MVHVVIKEMRKLLISDEKKKKSGCNSIVPVHECSNSYELKSSMEITLHEVKQYIYTVETCLTANPFIRPLHYYCYFILASI